MPASSGAGRTSAAQTSKTGKTESKTESNTEGKTEKGRKWMSKEQADACERAFHEWEGTVRDKGKEIAELAEQTGLTVRGTRTFITHEIRIKGFDTISNHMVPHLLAVRRFLRHVLEDMHRPVWGPVEQV
jgi:hypothetical protein